jgi:hypothetical protein
VPPQHLAAHGRRELRGHLVRHHLDEGLLGLDAVAFFHQPAHDLALVDALAQVRQLEFIRHAGLRAAARRRAFSLYCFR